MGWERVSTAVRQKRMAEGWHIASVIVGALAVALIIPAILSIGRNGAGGIDGPGVVFATAPYVLGLFPLLGLVAAAMDPVDAGSETRGARVLGALVGTVTAAAIPAILAAGILMVVLLVAKNVIGSGIAPLIALLVGSVLASAAWAALGLAVTARASSLARALVIVVATGIAVTQLVPLAQIVATTLARSSSPAATPWDVLFAYGDPTMLATQYVAAQVGAAGATSGSFYATLHGAIANFVGLALWIVLGAFVAVALTTDAPPAGPAQQPPGEAPGISPEPPQEPGTPPA